MNNKYKAVDEIYSNLKIHNKETKPRNSLNVGTMNRKLNTNFSTQYKNKQNMVWSSSTKDFKV